MRYFDVDSMGSAIDEAMQRTDAYVFGRRTWQVSAAAWPQRAGQDPFADKLNSLPKYVASRTPSEEDLTAWNNSHLLAPDDVLGAIAELKTREGGDINFFRKPIAGGERCHARHVGMWPRNLCTSCTTMARRRISARATAT